MPEPVQVSRPRVFNSVENGIRFALAAAVPSSIFSGLFTIGNLPWWPAAFLTFFLPLLLFRNALQRARKSVFSIACIYGLGLSTLFLAPRSAFIVAICQGRWPDASSLVGMMGLTLIGWAMMFVACFLAFGLPTAVWLRQVSDSLDGKEQTIHA